jgi:hypothetical protein
MGVASALWGNSRRKVTSSIVLVGAIATVILNVPAAWSMLGLPEVASKGYVREQVDPIRSAQADTTKAVYQLSLAQLQSSLYSAERDEATSPSDTVKQRIEELKDQIRQVQTKINASKN